MAFATSELTVSYDLLKMDDGKEARRLLEEQGIVIVSGVLSARECERAESGESGESGHGKFALTIIIVGGLCLPKAPRTSSQCGSSV